MTRILIFYDFFSPAFKAGGPIRSLSNLIEKLNKHTEIYVFTAAVDLDGSTLDVETDKWVEFKDNTKVFYATKKNLTPVGIYKGINEIKPHTVYINGLFTPYSVLFPLLALTLYKKSEGATKVVMAPRGMLQSGAMALKAGKKNLYLWLFKLVGLHKGLVWHATDYQELGDIRKFAGNAATIQLIPNIPVSPVYAVKEKKIATHIRLATISLIAEKKNHHFLVACFQEMPQHITIDYDIYGPIKDADYWRYLQQEIAKLPHHVRVDYKGALAPEQVVSTIKGYDCFVLPTLGENFGHAIFEALGSGVPVLISDKTPWKQLYVQHAGWDLPLEKSLWIDRLQKIAAMPDAEFRQWQEGAYNYALSFLEKQQLKEQYLTLLGITP